MSTHTQILYQIIYSTKNRERTLTKENRKRLFAYMYETLQNKKCHLYRINGVGDHLHIVTHLHPMQALAPLVKDLKLSATDLIKSERLFPHFTGWQVGYAAFTYAYAAKDNLIEYVKNQEEHHKKVSYEEELKALLKEHGVEYDERYLF